MSQRIKATLVELVLTLNVSEEKDQTNRSLSLSFINIHRFIDIRTQSTLSQLNFELIRLPGKSLLSDLPFCFSPLLFTNYT